MPVCYVCAERAHMTHVCFLLGYTLTGASHFGSNRSGRVLTVCSECRPISFPRISISGRKNAMMDTESDRLTVRMQNGVIGHSPCAFGRLSDTLQTRCTMFLAGVWSGCLSLKKKQLEDLYLSVKSIKIEGFQYDLL